MKTTTRHTLLASAFAVACLAIASPLHAQTWVAGGTDSNISTPANWDAVPDFVSGTSGVVFATSGTSATVDTNASLNSITLAGTSGFTIAGGAGTLSVKAFTSSSSSNGVITTGTVGSALNVTISSPLVVDTTSGTILNVISNNSPGAGYGLNFTGGLSSSGTNYSIRLGGTGTTIFSGPITSLLSIQQSAASSLSGTVIFDTPLALAGATSSVAIATTSNGTVGSTAVIQMGTSTSQNQSWVTTQVRQATVVIKSNAVTTGTVGIADAGSTGGTLAVDGNLSAVGLVLGSGTITGTLKISGSAGFSGAVTTGTTFGSKIVGNAATNGILLLSSGTIGSAVAIGGANPNENNLTLIKSGSTGTLTLNGTHTYTGGTQINGGVLSISSTSALPGATTNGGFSVASGAMLAVTNAVIDADVSAVRATGTSNFAVGSALGYDTSAGNRSLGTALSTSVGLGKAGTNTLTLTGTNVTGAVILVSGTIAGSAASDSLTGSSYDLRAGTVSISLGGTSSALTKSGTSTSTVTLSGSNSFGGGVSVNGGTLAVSNSNALGNTSGIIVASAASLGLTGTTTIGAGKNVTIAGNGVGNNGALQASGAGGGTWEGQVTLVVGGARIGATAGRTLTVTGSIVGSGSNENLSINGESGTGIVVLNPSGSNTYTGSTGIVRGILRLGKTDALPTGTVLDVDATGGLSEAATFDMAGFNQTVAALQDTASTSINGKVTNSGSNTLSILTVNQATDTDFAGIIENGAATTGTIALVKSGSGTLLLRGSNSYTGGTTVNTGGVTFANINAKSSSGTHAFGAGTTLGLGVSGSAGYFISADIDSAFASTGTMGGNLSNVTVTATTNVGIDTGAGDFVYASSVPNVAKGLVKSGANMLTLSGSNSYTGGTTIKSGTLQVGNVSALGSSSGAVAVNGGTLDLNGNSITVGALSGSSAGLISSSLAGSIVLTSSSATSGTYAGTIANGSGTVGLTKSGNGTLTLSGTSNTFSGSITVNGGILSGTTGSFGTALTGTNPINLNGGTLRYTGAASITSDTMAIVVGGGDATIAVTAATTTTLRAGGPLTGSGNLNIAGPGVVAFGQNIATTLGNTYSGTLTVKSGGQFDIRNPDSMGATGASARTIIESGGTLMINPFSQPLGVTFDAETLEFQGASSLLNRNQLTGTNSATVTNTLTGPISTSGTLTISSTVSSGSSAAILAINAPIGGPGALTFGGVGQPGTYELNGTNSYSGKTTVNTGTVKFGVSETLTGGLEIATSGTAVLTAHTGTVKVLDITGLTISGTTAFTGGGGKAADIAGYGSELASPAPVPEPGTIGLLVVGAIGGALLRRRCSRPL